MDAVKNSQWWQGLFIISSIFSLFVRDIPPFSLLIFGLALSFWLLLRSYRVVSVTIFAICWFFLHASWVTQWRLPQHLIKTPVSMIGVVSSIPSQAVDNTKFNLQLNVIAAQSIHWFNRPIIKINWQKADKTLQMGDTLQLTAKLKPAHGFANQGGFSYQKLLLLKGIRATGYVINKTPVIVLKPTSNYRQTIFNGLKQATDGLDYQGLILALTVGEKQFISAEQWQTIKATGISHLLAISGLHIGIVFLFGSLLAKWLIKMYCYIVNKHQNAPFIALFFGLLAALAYSWLAGFSIPTVRAFLMLSLLVLMLSVKQTINARSVIINTLFIILIIDPLSVLQPGLWLSFIAVVVIIATFWWFPTVNKRKNKLFSYSQSIVKMQMALFVFMVPVTVLIFNGFSASAAVVNLLAVPWVSFITVPISLVATVFKTLDLPSTTLFAIADHSLAGLFILLEQSWFKNGWVLVRHVPWFSWLAGIIFALSLLVSLNKFHRAASVLLLLPSLLSFANFNSTTNSWQVHVLDVGQGLSVVIEKDRRIMVYDLGPVYKSGFNTVDHVVLPFLTNKGFKNSDYLVISHADSDHSGAYQRFLANIKTQNIIAPHKILPHAQLCLPQTQLWQGLTVSVLWPTDKNTLPTNTNDSSCVIRISDQKTSVLLSGDISKRVEKKLLKNHGNKLASTILLAPHHGSNSSSSSEFVNAVNPRHVLYSTGYLNRYKFPRQTIVQRYKSAGARSYNTADTGQISFTVDESGVVVKTVRKDILPHWYYNR